MLPHVIRRFRTLFPEVRVSLQQGTAEQIAELASRNRIDVAMATGSHELFSQFVFLPCYRGSRRVVIPTSHPLVGTEKPSLAKLGAYPLASHVFTAPELSLREVFGDAGIDAHVALTTRDAEMIKTYVRIGLGVGVIADMAFAPEHDRDLAALDVSHLFPRETTWAGFSREATLRHYQYEFLGLLGPHLSRERIDHLAVSSRTRRSKSSSPIFRSPGASRIRASGAPGVARQACRSSSARSFRKAGQAPRCRLTLARCGAQASERGQCRDSKVWSSWGAGPVGFLTALGLARAGVPVRVLEAEARINDAPRASGYFPTTVAILEKLGLKEDVDAVAYWSSTFSYRMLATGETLHVDTARMLPPETVYRYNAHFGQHVLAEIVSRHLQRLPDTQVSWNTRLVGLNQDSGGVTLDVETPAGREQILADWVVGTDGARSTTRHLLGLPFEGHTWPERFVATNLYYDFEKYGFEPANMIVDPVNWRSSHGLDARTCGGSRIPKARSWTKLERPGAFQNTTRPSCPTPRRRGRSLPPRLTVFMNAVRPGFAWGACCSRETRRMRATRAAAWDSPAASSTRWLRSMFSRR